MMVPPAARRSAFAAMLGVVLLTASAVGQQGPRPDQTRRRGYPRDTLLAAARDIMAAARYTALITLDAAGHPQARAIDPFAPDSDFVVWIGTSRRTRKVGEIRRDPRVTLYYFDGVSAAYVTIRGTARIVTDAQETARRWKPEWEALYPDRAEYVLIAVTPRRLEIVSERLGIVGDPVTWEPPAVEFR
jgi:general stress protein 26